MNTLTLSNNKSALIDHKDFKRAKVYRWYFNSTNGYAFARINKINTYLHRFLINTPSGYYTDHINGDKLDNRRANLRICTSQQSGQNRPKRLNTSSKFRGVTWDKERKLWQASITLNYKYIFIGRFKSEKEAALARDLQAKKHYGAFAKLNFKL